MTDLRWIDGLSGGVRDVSGAVELDGDALRARVDARADTLRQAGLQPGQLLAVNRGPSWLTIVDLLAAWRLGACVAPLDPTLSEPEQANVLARARPALMSGDGQSVDLAPTWEDGPRQFDGDMRDRAALILFTSGTTGTPKGVVLTLRALEARIALNAQAIGQEALAQTLLTLPMHFGHGLIGGVLTPLFNGGWVNLAGQGLDLASRLAERIDTLRIRHMTSVPAFWRLALRLSPPPKAGSLRRIHVGSAPLSEALWRQIGAWCGAPVFNCYGITETANWIGGTSAPRAEGDVGLPWGGAYAVRAEDGVPKSAGEGEVLVRSASIMAGYLDLPDETDRVLCDGWYATGDTGRLDPDGLILTGRIKDEINRAGLKVQPVDVDRVLEAHPDVAEACCFGVPDPLAGERVAAALVPVDPQTGIDLAALSAWCQARLRPMARPEVWFVVDAIPRNARGKVNRRQVAAQLTQEAG